MLSAFLTCSPVSVPLGEAVPGIPLPAWVLPGEKLTGVLVQSAHCGDISNPGSSSCLSVGSLRGNDDGGILWLWWSLSPCDNERMHLL